VLSEEPFKKFENLLVLVAAKMLVGQLDVAGTKKLKQAIGMALEGETSAVAGELVKDNTALAGVLGLVALYTSNDEDY
jgi:calcineurin-like phosphoesterase